VNQTVGGSDKKGEVPPAVRDALFNFLAAARTYAQVCAAHGISGESGSGRKTLCKRQLTDQICELLADSVSIRTTCEMVGIGESTFHAWCVRGAFGETPFAEFLERTTRARAQARVTIVRGIRTAGAKDHRALEWLAEHCHADEFCPQKEQQVNLQVRRGRGGLLPPWAVGKPQIQVMVEPVKDAETAGPETDNRQRTAGS
jgi:hypothetical protein